MLALPSLCRDSYGEGRAREALGCCVFWSDGLVRWPAVRWPLAGGLLGALCFFDISFLMQVFDLGLGRANEPWLWEISFLFGRAGLVPLEERAEYWMGIWKDEPGCLQRQVILQGSASVYDGEWLSREQMKLQVHLSQASTLHPSFPPITHLVF